MAITYTMTKELPLSNRDSSNLSRKAVEALASSEGDVDMAVKKFIDWTEADPALAEQLFERITLPAVRTLLEIELRRAKTLDPGNNLSTLQQRLENPHHLG